MVDAHGLWILSRAASNIFLSHKSTNSTFSRLFSAQVNKPVVFLVALEHSGSFDSELACTAV
jgi:hypothetical protein